MVVLAKNKAKQSKNLGRGKEFVLICASNTGFWLAETWQKFQSSFRLLTRKSF
jgi:hypothetical protein